MFSFFLVSQRFADFLQSEVETPGRCGQTTWSEASKFEILQIAL